MVSFAIFIPLAIGLVIFSIIALVQRNRLNKASVDAVSLRRAQQNWSEPTELKYASPPRAARIKLSAKILIGLFVGIGIFLTVMMSVNLRRAEQQQARAELLANSPTETATITRKHSEQQGKSISHWIVYSFSVAGQIYNGQSLVDKDEYRRHSSGETLPVHYNVINPNESGLLIEQKPPPMWVNFLFFLFPAAMLAFAPLNYRKYWRLIVSGQTAPGVVILVTRGKNGYLVHYQFCDDRDRLIRGKGFAERAKVPQLGDTVTVLYMRNESNKNTLYPNAWIELKS